MPSRAATVFWIAGCDGSAPSGPSLALEDLIPTLEVQMAQTRPWLAAATLAGATIAAPALAQAQITAEQDKSELGQAKYTVERARLEA